MPHRPSAAAWLLATSIASASLASGTTLPANPGLEDGAIGAVPDGWLSRSAEDGAYRAILAEESPHQGRRCGRIESLVGAPSGFGNLMQVVDATALRGQRVRLRAAVRVRDAARGSRAQAWMRVDLEGGGAGFFDNMADRPVTSPEWVAVEIVGDVAKDAKAVAFGLILTGPGPADLDDVSLEPIGPAGEGNVAPRELTRRGLDNLVAFARLAGYVRYFHPSDGAAGTRWEDFLISSIEQVEPAPTAEALAQVLEELFRPMAPAVRVAPSGGRRTALPGFAPDATAPRPDVIARRHLGVATGDPRSIYSSRRARGREIPSDVVGEISRHVDAAALRGRRVRLRASLSAAAPPPCEARLGMTVERPQGMPGFADDGASTAVTGPAWTRREVTGYVADDALRVRIDLVLAGSGTASFDDVVLETIEADGSATPVDLGTGDPDEAAATGAPAGWRLSDRAAGNAFRAELATATPEGTRPLVLSRPLPAAEELPDPLEPLVADLGGGVSCVLPMALFVDEDGKVPPAWAGQPWSGVKDRPAGWTPSGDDRSTRLADVVLAWNVFQHFHPYLDVADTDWMTELPRALATAATDDGSVTFRATLERLVAALRDGHGYVAGHADFGATLPLAWDWVDDRLVVTHVAPSSGLDLRAGDAILRIDGRDVAAVAAELESRVSGATPQWRRHQVRRTLLRGPAESVVRLDVRSPDGAERRLEVRRVPWSEDALEPRPEKIAELQPGIQYVDLDRVTDEDFEEALPRLQAATGLVFDLRGYPNRISTIVLSHLIDAPITCARWNVPVVTRPDRQAMGLRFSNWTVQPKTPRLRGKAAFVTGGGAISYAETYLGMVEHYRLAEIVGGPTAGTNGNVNPFALPGGYTVGWTGMKVLKHDGSRHHGIGIQPTVPVSRTLAGVAAGRDEALDRAIDVVSGAPARPAW